MTTASRFSEVDDRIAAFWLWWSTAAPALADDLLAGQGARWQPELSERVRDLHPRLQWDLRVAAGPLFTLCLSGAGDAVVRLVAERWRVTAPDDDPRWAFRSTRPAAGRVAEVSLRIGGEMVQLDEVRVAVEDDPGRERLNLVVYHPVFAQLPTATRESLAVLLLDHALGEDVVESWTGAIDAATACPADALEISGLLRALDDRRDRATGTHWGVVTAESPDGMLFRIANHAVKRWSYPTFDARCDIVLPLERRTPAGIPDPWESDELKGIEEGLQRALAERVLIVGRTSGRNEHVVHLYAREDSIAPQAIAVWARRMQRPVSVSWTFDPEWSVLTERPS